MVCRREGSRLVPVDGVVSEESLHLVCNLSSGVPGNHTAQSASLGLEQKTKCIAGDVLSFVVKSIKFQQMSRESAQR